MDPVVSYRTTHEDSLLKGLDGYWVQGEPSQIVVRKTLSDSGILEALLHELAHEVIGGKEYEAVITKLAALQRRILIKEGWVWQPKKRQKRIGR